MNNPTYFFLEKNNEVLKVMSSKQAKGLSELTYLKKITKDEAINKKTVILELSAEEFDLRNNPNADFLFVENKEDKILVKQKTLNQNQDVRELNLSTQGMSNAKLTDLSIGEYTAYVEPLKKSMKLIVSENVHFGEITRVCYLEDHGFYCWKTVLS